MIYLTNETDITEVIAEQAHLNGAQYIRSITDNTVYEVLCISPIVFGVVKLSPAQAVKMLSEHYDDKDMTQYYSQAVIDWLELEPKLTDAEADLAGKPRPDNPSKYTEPGDTDYCKSCDIVSKIDGIILARLNDDRVIDNESANVLAVLNQISISRSH